MQARGLVSGLTVLLWPTLGSLASDGTFKKQGSCTGDEVSLLQAAPGQLRRGLPPDPGIEEWQRHGIDYNMPQLSRRLASRNSYAPQSESELPNMEVASAGQQGTPRSFSQSLAEASALQVPASSEELAIARGIEQGRALQSALDREQLTLQRTGRIAHSSAGYTQPSTSMDDAIGQDGAQRQMQSALQKTRASGLTPSLIEKQAELEVSDAFAEASERVRRAEAKALAAMEGERLDAYSQVGDAGDAPMSLLSYGSRVLPAAPRSEPQNGEGPWWWTATPATTTTTFAPPGEGSTCGISGKLDCNMFNRMFTWNYSTHWGKGVLIWLLLIILMMCCCGGCIWRFFELALWIALGCCCCFVLAFFILYGIFNLLDH